MKTLAFIQTHTLNSGVISELKKLKAAENERLRVALFIDNSKNIVANSAKISARELKFIAKTPKFDFNIAKNSAQTPKFNAKFPLQMLEFDDFKVPALLCDERLLREFSLPFNAGSEQNVSIAQSLWHNGDYTFYLMRRYFADFDFYWHFDYDCFYNDSDYASFFAEYEGDETDLLVSYFRKEPPDSKWPWIDGTQWAYSRDEIYGCFFPAPRMSARLADALYERRVAQGVEFAKPSAQRKVWANNELFVATECVRLGFSAKPLKSHDKTGLDEIDLNTTRLFEKPDKCLYHPIKGEFIARLERAGGIVCGESKDEMIKRLKNLEHFGGFVKFYTHKQFIAKPKNFLAKIRRKTRFIRYPIKRFFGFGGERV